MIKRGRKGAIELSFGMLFAIILIAATIAVAFYVISYFMSFKKCSDIGLFSNELKNKVNDMSAAPEAEATFNASLPSAVNSVCFGNLNLAVTGEDEIKRIAIKKTGTSLTNNVFIYPASACSEINAFKLDNVVFEGGFFCVKTAKSAISIPIEKNFGETFVTIKKA